MNDEIGLEPTTPTLAVPEICFRRSANKFRPRRRLAPSLYPPPAAVGLATVNSRYAVVNHRSIVTNSNEEIKKQDRRKRVILNGVYANRVGTEKDSMVYCHTVFLYHL